MTPQILGQRGVSIGNERLTLTHTQSHEYVVSMWIHDLHVRDMTRHDNANAALASARAVEMYYGIGGEGTAKVHVFNLAYSKPILRSPQGKWRDATPLEMRELNVAKRLIVARPFGQTSLGWIRVKAFAQVAIPKTLELTSQALVQACQARELTAEVETLPHAVMVHGLGIEHGLALDDLRCELQGRQVVFSGDIRIAVFQSFGRHTSFHDVNDLLSFDAGRKALMSIFAIRSCAMKLHIRGVIRSPESASAEPVAIQLPVHRWELRASTDAVEEQLDMRLQETVRA